MSQMIAIPSEKPGGMDTAVGEHFGHCDIYTLVRVQAGEIVDVQILPNEGHEHGGCMVPVQRLADQNVTQLIAGGMGMRPLMGFSQKGIAVFRGIGNQTVGEAVQALLAGQLQQFGVENTCQGCSDH